MSPRQMVGTRKGGALPTIPTNAAGKDATVGATDSTPDDSDVVKCPNCDCEFNEATQDVVKPGKAVVDDGSAPEGADLSAALPPGSPHDAAYGDGIIGNVLAGLKSRVQ